MQFNPDIYIYIYIYIHIVVFKLKSPLIAQLQNTNMENEKHLIYVLRNCKVTLQSVGVSFLRRNIAMSSCYFLPRQLHKHGVIWLEDLRQVSNSSDAPVVQRAMEASRLFWRVQRLFINFFLGATTRICKPVGTNLR